MLDKLIEDLKNNIEYFEYHNKNLTKEQDAKIDNIKESIKRLEEVNVYFEVCKCEVISAIEDIYNDELYAEYESKIEKIDDDTINTIAWKIEDDDVWHDIYEYARDEIIRKIAKEVA